MTKRKRRPEPKSLYQRARRARKSKAFFARRALAAATGGDVREAQRLLAVAEGKKLSAAVYSHALATGWSEPAPPLKLAA